MRPHSNRLWALRARRAVVSTIETSKVYQWTAYDIPDCADKLFRTDSCCSGSLVVTIRYCMN
jgi:hypothetical protein